MKYMLNILFRAFFSAFCHGTSATNLGRSLWLYVGNDQQGIEV